MSNPIVYICTGRIRGVTRHADLQMQQIPRNWMDSERVTPERYAAAKRTLRETYDLKAAAVGITLEQYCIRFNVKL